MATLIRSTEPPPSGQRLPVVLVAEDSEDDFFFLQRAFRQAEIQARVEWARDGLEARERLESLITAGILPIGIVLDLKMPRMDGFELLDLIKSNPACNGIPVNILTTSTNPTDMARAHRLGAKGYLVKPVAFEALVKIMQDLQNQWSGTPGLNP